MGDISETPRLEVSNQTPPPNNLERNTKENKEKEKQPEREREASHSQKNEGELRSPLFILKKTNLGIRRTDATCIRTS